MDAGEHSDASLPEARQRAPGAALADAEARRAWRALLALESPATLDFDDPTVEWRQLLAEIPGTFAADVLRGDFSSYWVYVVGPLAGALLAVAFAFVLRGPGGDPGGRRAGAGLIDSRRG